MSNSTMGTAQVYDNEVVKASDFNDGFTSLIDNLNILTKMIFDSENDCVIGGVVIPDAPAHSMNLYIKPLFGFSQSSNVVLGDTSVVGPVPVQIAVSKKRIDTLQIRGAFIDIDEQQRAFNDPSTDVKTYRNVATKKRLKVEYQVKMGTEGSSEAPLTDEGWIKLAEIHVLAGVTELSEENICNITSDTLDGINGTWTNEKQRTINIGFISDVRKIIRAEHNLDGSHKDCAIKRGNIDLGIGNNQINNKYIPAGETVLIKNKTYGAETASSELIKQLGILITGILELYKKDDQRLTFLSEVGVTNNTDNNTPLILGAAADGTCYISLGNTKMMSIAQDGSITLAEGYTPHSSLDIVNKSVTDSLDKRVSDLRTDFNHFEASTVTMDDINLVQNNLDTHKSLTGNTDEKPHGATALPDVSSLMCRDTQGRSNVKAPIALNEIANREWTESIFSRMNFTEAFVATSNNIILTGEQTIDGISVTAGKRVLVRAQSDARINGLWVCQTGEWNRATDYDSDSKIRNRIICISNGLTFSGKSFTAILENLIIDTVTKLANKSISFSEVPFSSHAKPDRITCTDKDGFLHARSPEWDDISQKVATMESVKELIRNFCFPVGFRFTQLPGQKEPKEMWGGKWIDVSAEYASSFLRILGNDSAPFGETQGEGLPNITGSVGGFPSRQPHADGCFTIDGGEWAGYGWGTSSDNRHARMNASRSNPVYGKSTHVTPVNIAVRVWKRTA